MKIYTYVLLLFIISFVIYIIDRNIILINPDDIPDVKWPFINLKDENGKNINMLCIRGHMMPWP